MAGVILAAFKWLRTSLLPSGALGTGRAANAVLRTPIILYHTMLCSNSCIRRV